jgi:putative aldouronate transport system substrate-binding protein
MFRVCIAETAQSVRRNFYKRKEIKMLKKLTLLALLCLLTGGIIFAEGQMDYNSKGVKIKDFSIYLARERDNYPKEGTYLGKWLTEQTAARMKWEFPVGDPKQKLGLLIASGDYPDMMDCRNDDQALYDAKAFIPLDDLIEKYGTNIKKWLGDKIDMCRKADGHIYWIPALFPYGNKLRRTVEDLAFYVQKRFLKDNNWPMPKNVDQAFDMLIAYAKKNPTTKGKKTLVWTAMSTTWRDFPLMNAPHVFSGHPNDGSANVDMVNGKWIATQYYATPEAYKIYKLYNKVFLAGLYDTESFVRDYDQYLAAVAAGNVLAFTDQRWQFDVSNRLLKKQNEDLWYAPMSIVMDGYTEEWNPPPGPQVSEGVGISVKCKDPVLAFKWLDAQASEEFQILKWWGVKGENYSIDKDGYFYRTPAQLTKWKDQKWRDKVFGQTYFSEIVCWDHGSIYSDGKNSVDPQNQPTDFYANLTDTEKEVLNGYGKKTWFDFCHGPDIRRAAYFPLWTIKIPTGSDVDIASNKVHELRTKWVPLLIMAPAGKYDTVWNQFLAELKKIPNQDKLQQFYQDEMDKRLRVSGVLK